MPVLRPHSMRLTSREGRGGAASGDGGGGGGGGGGAVGRNPRSVPGWDLDRGTEDDLSVPDLALDAPSLCERGALGLRRLGAEAELLNGHVPERGVHVRCHVLPVAAHVEVPVGRLAEQ